MDAGKYQEYLRSAYWRRRREELMERLGSKCFNCGLPRFLAKRFDGVDLNIDHLNYRNIGCEAERDVQILCRKCHEAKSFREDRRKEHLAHCYGRMAKTEEEWGIIAWMAMLERGHLSPWKDRRVAEMELMRAAEGLSVAEIDTCFAECIRQSFYGGVQVGAFRHAAAQLKFDKKNQHNQFFTKRRAL